MPGAEAPGLRRPGTAFVFAFVFVFVFVFAFAFVFVFVLPGCDRETPRAHAAPCEY
jgi:hypothetical protein